MNPTLYSYHDPFNLATYEQLERLLKLVDYLPIDSVDAFISWAKNERLLSKPLDNILRDWEEWVAEIAA